VKLWKRGIGICLRKTYDVEGKVAFAIYHCEFFAGREFREREDDLGLVDRS